MPPVLREKLKQNDVLLSQFQYEKFNLSEKMNFSVAQAKGAFVVLLNDDMEIIEEGWLTEMLMWAQQDDVCAVGAKLFFPDGRIQHAGVLLLGQGPSHPYYLSKGSEVGLVCNAILPHEASAVTGACLMVRKTDYEVVGGFDPFFTINYNDVDFCIRLRQRTGKRIIFTPFAQLYHHESVSRDPAPPAELLAINQRWSSLMGHDPYYNPHLSQSSGRYEIASSVRSLANDYGLYLTDDPPTS
jgi:GT2 family glycosyltransferase